MSSRVLVLELNELCPPLLDRFMAEGDLPGFSRLRNESTVYVTTADEPQDRLNPWVQWVTAHTGVGFEEHGVFKLGEGDRLRQPTVADEVGDAGGTVWLCGPMNVVPTRSVRGTWLPDPWNPDESKVSEELVPFAEFVRANVQEHSNERHRMSARSYGRFLWFMVRHGLSVSTVREALSQLAGERTGRRARWRRAALLDRFQWDLFERTWRRDRPTFATYFSNTTAHYQHVYWRYMEPEAFEVRPTNAELQRYGGAVRSGYLEMDRLVGRALDLVDADTTLVFCTAISQQPYLLKEAQGGSRYYRPHDLDSFVRSLGVAGVERLSPVMSSQYHVFFGSPEAAAAAEAALTGATVGGQAAFDVRRNGTDLLVGFAVTGDLPRGSSIDVPATGTSVSVDDSMYRAETSKSGYHHPEGALWIRRPDRVAVDGGVVSLRSVAPTLLSLLGVDVPATMRAPVLRTDATRQPG